ncbi:hypothetical protein PG997_008100 [Apiospora hydei]|uniref:Uncharacterized protein n=1 Tax=Apiospora hydei TaxID=1337664 RepID=A0ABR1W9X9_9PEZI
MSRRGSGDSNASTASYCSAQSDVSIQSYYSILSDDSYAVELKPIDKSFLEMCEEVRILDTERNILEERKMQSHNAKKRDPKDTAERVWPDAQAADYKVYKELVRRIRPVKDAHDAAMVAVKNSKNADLATIEAARTRAMTVEQTWVEAAMA